jgi:hypothetical protein
VAAPHQLSRFATLFLTNLLVTGCGVTTEVGRVIAPPRGFVATDFCADLMTRAYPQASFEVTDRQSKETSITTVTTTIAAHRTDVTADADMSDAVAVECRFDHNVLVGFRWTKGPFGQE